MSASARLIGHSRAGRPIRGWRLGTGPLRISLLGGCHADEPVGPRFLRRFLRELTGPRGDELRAAATWTVIPHLNPDGAIANDAWQTPGAASYDFADWLRHRRRELPGEDIEFGFPRGPDDLDAARPNPDRGESPAERTDAPSLRSASAQATAAVSNGDAGPANPDPEAAKAAQPSPPRPENVAAWRFWRSGAPYDLHVSMHGMSVAAGPYFLVERSWWPRFADAARELATEVATAGYTLHDVERNGEKGFHRLAPGFCSRPDSRAMRRHFLALGDPRTAARFRPSSMEAVRTLSGGGTLTLVTEMPLFVIPGVGRELGPPDPALMRWRERIAGWGERVAVAVGEGEGVAARVQAEVRAEAVAAGLKSMPVRDQMRFQRAFIGAGLSIIGSAAPIDLSFPQSPGASRTGRNAQERD